MNIPQKHLADFKDFALDHIKEFDAAPCEFEAKDGTVYDAGDCWRATVSLGLDKLLTWGA
jgi:hypothetical protein